MVRRYIRIIHTLIPVGTPEWVWRLEPESPGAHGEVIGVIATGAAATSTSTTKIISIKTTSTAAATGIRLIIEAAREIGGHTIHRTGEMRLTIGAARINLAIAEVRVGAVALVVPAA